MAKSNSQQAIRRFHALGKRANRVGDRRKKREDVVWGTLEELGAETRAEKNRLMEARRFARLFDKEELDHLFDLSAEEGWEFKRSHILQLIRAAGRDERKDLAELCAENAWSVRELQLEIDRRGLHRPYGGRKQKPPMSDEAALLVTERLLSSLIRWRSVVAPLEEGTSRSSTVRAKKRKLTRRKGADQARLPDKVRRGLVDISDAAFDLCEKIRDELEACRRKSPTTTSQRK